jgi:hypothetical protein
MPSGSRRNRERDTRLRRRDKPTSRATITHGIAPSLLIRHRDQQAGDASDTRDTLGLHNQKCMGRCYWHVSSEDHFRLVKPSRLSTSTRLPAVQCHFSVTRFAAHQIDCGGPS